MNQVLSLKIPDFRFYHILFFDNNIGKEKILSKVRKQLDNKISYEKLDLIKLADFPYKHYNSIGVVAIYMGDIDTTNDYKPKNVFDTSVIIQEELTSLNSEVKGILFDELNLHPYALTVASKIEGRDKVLWDKETIQEHKKSIGPWIEYYSGQWEDYSNKLYQERIQHNLSNRLSELHYIRSNSSFIFMPREDERWKDWMEYMEDKFVRQILLSKAIQFSLMLLNDELDRVSKRARNFEGNNLAIIDKEMSTVEDLQQLVANITSELNRERLMNRLHHSTKVVRRCFEVFSLKEANQIISDKLQNIQDLVQTKHNAVQNRFQTQQKRWLLILNALIGYQVAFTMRDQLISFLNLDPNGIIASSLSIGIWGSIVLLAVIAVIGLTTTYLRKRTLSREEII